MKLRMYYVGVHREIPPASARVDWGRSVEAFFASGPGGSILTSYEYFKGGRVDSRFKTLLRYKKGKPDARTSKQGRVPAKPRGGAGGTQPAGDC